MHRVGLRESGRSSGTPRTTSTCGPPSWLARFGRPAVAQATSSHIAYGYGLFTGGLGAHYGAERLGCTVIPMSGGQTEKQVQLIVDFRPDIIMVTPSYMLNIAEEFVRQGRDRCAAWPR
jgi:phenylacetate-coenzyme A ligase PaaK-like adenylate-forming protein